MAKTKSLEKKDKVAPSFDKKTPASRVKSINDEKKPKKVKTPNPEKQVEKNVKKLAKEVKEATKAEDIVKATKMKKSLQSEDTKEDEEMEVKSTSTAVAPAELASKGTIKNAVVAAKQGIDKENTASDKANLFDDELRYGLQVIAMKVPKCPPHTRKILLEHSLHGEKLDICFIVRDSLPKKKDDHSESIRRIEDLLTEVGVTDVKTILPLTKLKQDFGPNNMKLKLLHTYDLFLVESEIAEHVYSLLGKHFIKKRKRPLQVDTTAKETIKFTVENAKRKVAFKLSAGSNLTCIDVGTHKMENSKIVANIVSALEQLKTQYPGGWVNIKKLYLKPLKASKINIPLYYSKIAPNEVDVPVIKGIKQTRLDKMSDLMAKKSKRMKVDRVKKRVIRLNPEIKTKKDVKEGDKPAVAGDKKNKDKKRKLTETTEETPAKKQKEDGAVDSEDKAAAKKARKEKKKANKAATSGTPVAAPVVAAPEATEKPKKNKKAKTEAAPAPVVAAVAEKPAKKEKKSKSAPAVVVAEEPATDGKKKKNKKNKTAA